VYSYAAELNEATGFPERPRRDGEKQPRTPVGEKFSTKTDLEIFSNI
jgi:hypothetical protein